MGKTSRRRWWLVGAAGLLIAGAVGVFGLVWFIEASANGEARLAQQRFSGDRVEALIHLVESDRQLLQERNRAVWALGRLRDARALPVLRKYYTGGKCDHAKYLCQSELRKAIDLCAGTSKAPGWLESVMRWAVARS
jgi:hypothetical protein